MHLAISGAHTFVILLNPFKHFVDYGEGECYTQLRLSRDSQESLCMDFHSSLFMLKSDVRCTCEAVPYPSLAFVIACVEYLV